MDVHTVHINNKDLKFYFIIIEEEHSGLTKIYALGQGTNETTRFRRFGPEFREIQEDI